MSYFYLVISKIFNVGKSIEETLLLRSLIVCYLNKFGVMQSKIPSQTVENEIQM